MLKSSHHLHQTATFPQTNFPLRNPWLEKVDSSTNSSCGTRSGHTAKSTIPLPAAEWLLPGSQSLSNFGPLLNQQVHPVIVQAPNAGSAMSVGHESFGAVSANGGIGSCGGQCVACETFCYYCLQVIFIAGILTGIALTIAGSVLHENQREGDLVVLLYIGVLLVLVCVLLLSVHCCVRRNVKERKRALHMSLMEGPRRETSHEFTGIPIQDFTVDPSLGNSYAETYLNDFDSRENPRPLLNVIPNPAVHFQSRPIKHFSGVRAHLHDGCSCGSEIQQSYERGKYPQPNVNRLLR